MNEQPPNIEKLVEKRYKFLEDMKRSLEECTNLMRDDINEGAILQTPVKFIIRISANGKYIEQEIDVNWNRE
jgi:hypothetical protein